MKNIYWEKGEFKWWILLLCSYHFFPFITTRGSTLMYLWAYGIPIIYMAFNLNYLKKLINVVVRTEVLQCVVFLVLLSCLSILVPILYGTYDFTYFSDAIMTMLKILFRMLFIVLLIMRFIPNATKETFMKYFIFSCCLYICGTIVMLIVPHIRELFLELVKESEYSKELAAETRYSTRYGWAGFSGFEYTFKCVLALIFNDYFISKVLKHKKMWYMIGVSLFLMVGTLFYGRVGVLFGIVIFVFLFIRLLVKRPKILLAVISIGVMGCVALVVLYNKSEAVQSWVAWAFDLFINFFKTGKLETYSSNVLLDKMLFVPEAKTMLFGDGRYTADTGSYYMSTDAGIMRTMLFGGIVFAGIRYLSLYMLLIVNALKKGQSSETKRLLYWVLILCITFEIKGEILFSCLPIVLWLIVMDKYGYGGIIGNGKRFEFKKIG